MEVARDCFTSTWNLFQNAPEIKTPGRYYFAPEGTPFYPGPHPYFSRYWTSDDSPFGPLGESRDSVRRYTRGSLGIPHPPLVRLGTEACVSGGAVYPAQTAQRTLARGVDCRCWTLAGQRCPGDILPDGGFEADGEAIIYWTPPVGSMCDVDCWLLMVSGFSGECAALNGTHMLTRDSDCQWLWEDLSGGYGSAAGFDGPPYQIPPNVSITISYNSSTTGFHSHNYQALASDVGFLPGDVTTFTLASTFFPCASPPGTVTITPCVSAGTITGDAGVEADGEATIQLNWITGDGGFEVDGPNSITDIITGDGGFEFNGDGGI